MPAAITNTIGANTKGHLIHMHPGNECQKNAFIAMQFPHEQINRCINVNIYSVLRCYYQNKNSYSQNVENNEKETISGCNSNILGSPNTCAQIDNKDILEEDEPSVKKLKLEEIIPKRSWQIDNERACRILDKKIDSLTVTAKEHPVTIVAELISFLNGNRNLVVFNCLREPLQDLYIYLKSRCDIVNIRFMNSFMRNYQVLSGRTHPEVNMTNGGYILTATKLN